MANIYITFNELCFCKTLDSTRKGITCKKWLFYPGNTLLKNKKAAFVKSG